MDYDASKIAPVHFPAPIRMKDGKLRYDWNVEFVDAIEGRKGNYDLSVSGKYDVKLKWKSDTEVVVEVCASEAMENLESFQNEFKLFQLLNKKIGEISKIEGLEKEKWPFFRF